MRGIAGVTAALERRDVRRAVPVLYVVAALCGWLLHVANAIWAFGGAQGSGPLALPMFVALGFAAATSCMVRAARTPTERWSWLTIAAGLTAYSTGSLLYFASPSLALGTFPTVSDGLWLSLFVALAVAAVGVIAARLRPASFTQWLDSAIAGLAAVAVGVAVLEPWVLDGRRVSTSVALGQMSYPLLELVLLALFIVMIGLRVWRPSVMQLVIVTALVTFLVTDAVYAYRIAHATYHAGTILDSGWPLGLTLVGFAAVPRPRPKPTIAPGRLGMAVVAVTSAAMVVVILLPMHHAAPKVLGVFALALVVARLCLSVAQAEAAQRQLTYSALHDELTGLGNRVMFQDRLAHAVALHARQTQELVVIVCDIDGFKSVNDTWGHSAGDRVLVEASCRLADAVRASDTVVRLGGDEFAVVAEGASVASGVHELAERIRTAFLAPMTVDGHVVHMRASVGAVAVAGDDPVQSGDELLAHADIAMYVAKRKGKNRTEIYNADTTLPDLDDPSIVEELANAIDNGTIEVVYQPIVAVASGNVDGFEALARWRCASRPVSPEVFVPMAERAGLGPRLGDHVLGIACAELAQWQRLTGHSLTMSVNVSASQLLDPEFPARVASVLERYGVPPQQLVLEITERDLLPDDDTARAVAESLHRSGVRLALDDFGTGFSSLTHLHVFPISILKIDRSFVQAAHHDDRRVAFIRGIRRMAESLRLETIVEGVETAEQLNLVRELGCQYAQGYLLGRPAGPSQTLVALRTRRAVAAHAGARSSRRHARFAAATTPTS